MINDAQKYVLMQHGVYSDDIVDFDDLNGRNEITYKDGTKRTMTQIFSRTMGYFRPLSDWNVGKKAEFASRKSYLIKECDYIEKQAAE